jgi:hypothetical protein
MQARSARELRVSWTTYSPYEDDVVGVVADDVVVEETQITGRM